MLPVCVRVLHISAPTCVGVLSVCACVRFGGEQLHTHARVRTAPKFARFVWHKLNRANQRIGAADRLAQRVRGVCVIICGASCVMHALAWRTGAGAVFAHRGRIQPECWLVCVCVCVRVHAFQFVRALCKVWPFFYVWGLRTRNADLIKCLTYSPSLSHLVQSQVKRGGLPCTLLYRML